MERSRSRTGRRVIWRAVLTRGEQGNSSRIGDEYIQLPKVTKYAVHSVPYALYITHVRSTDEHIRARYGRNDYFLRLDEAIPSACHNRNRGTRTRILKRSFAPDAARSARNENNFSVVRLRGVQWLGIDGGVDADAG